MTTMLATLRARGGRRLAEDFIAAALILGLPFYVFHLGDLLALAREVIHG